MLEGRHDLLEELRRQVVALRQGAQRDGSAALVPDEVDQRAEAVFGAARQSHGRHRRPECLVAWWPFRPFEHPCEMAACCATITRDGRRRLTHPVRRHRGRGGPRRRGRRFDHGRSPNTSASKRSRPTCPCCCRPRRAGERRPTTSCCTARRASARRPSPRSSRASSGSTSATPRARPSSAPATSPRS